jgi:hypothetical protein
MTAQRHRLERNVWIAAAPATWLAAVLMTIGAPHIAPYVITPHTWVWCIVGAAYHQGWLRAHRDQPAVEETTE